MKRREFVQAALVGGAGPLGLQAGVTSAGSEEDIAIERAEEGRPHEGKVLAVIVSHTDDARTGTVAKLIAEGYTAYLIRTSNDEKDSYDDLSLGETVAANEDDARGLARVLGIREVFDLNYRNHRMDGVSPVEIRARLIFLFRLLKVDTVMTWDPWGHYEENPDHYVTARAVEAACWMAGGRKDYPEHFAAGLEPHAVTEKYYAARGPQWVNRVVDISTTVDKKMDAWCACRTMVLHMVGRLRDELASQNLRLPILDGDDETVIRNFVEARWRPRDARVGLQYGLEYAEAFHYIGPSSPMEDYIRENAVPI